MGDINMTKKYDRMNLRMSTRLIYDELHRQNASVSIIDAEASLLRYNDTAGVSHYIFSTCSDKSSATGMMIARNKPRTASIAAQLNIPIPDARVCDTFEQAAEFLATHGTIVVKPLDNKGGVGVSTDIHTKTALRKAYAYAHTQGTQVLVQQHLYGDDIRLLVIANTFVSAVTRAPARVQGNGTSTIKELIETDNNHESRNNTDISSLMHIDIEAAERYLGSKISDTPDDKVFIQVVGPANVSLGGSLREATHLATERMKRDAIKITSALGLGICGVDMIWNRETDNYGLIEINAVPGIDIHDDPFSGTSSDAAKKYVDWLIAA